MLACLVFALALALPIMTADHKLVINEIAGEKVFYGKAY
jgi:hypothetical protein